VSDTDASLNVCGTGCLQPVPTPKNWLGWKDANLRMAGSKPAALPLGDTPASVRPRGELAGAHLTAASRLPPVLEQLVHRRAVQAPSHEAPPAIGNPRRQALGLTGTPARAEHARAGARQVRRRKPRQPLERFRHLR